MSERSCPASGSTGSGCPVGEKNSRLGPRGCNFNSFAQAGDLRASLNIPTGVDTDQFLRQRERKAINEVLYSNVPHMKQIKALQNDRGVKSLDSLNASDEDLLAVALGAPARQVLLRAEEVGPRTGWRDGYLSVEHGFTPPDTDEAAGALARSSGRIWSDLCERMPGCVARGRVRESIAALPIVEGTANIIPDRALWAALVALGMLCSIYRYEEKHNGTEGINVASSLPTSVEMSDELGDEVKGIPLSIGLPYYQICKRMGRSIPHLTFFDQSSYNVKVKDPTSSYPYVGRFENMDLRWPMFGDSSEIAFLKGCADTSASFQHGVDAMANCQEYVMTKNREGLLRELIRLKEILERMPNAFHSISMNPSSGDNYVSPAEWVRWAKFSAPLSKRCPATSGLQFPPYLVMDAFLGRKKYNSFLGAEGIHLRAWLPSNWRAFIAAIEYHYSIPEFVADSQDSQLIGALDGIVEAYAGERGFMGVHRYKVFGLLEVAGKTGRTETNGQSGAPDSQGRPWEETHKAFSDAMKERLEPYRGSLDLEPHQIRGTFGECRYTSRVIGRYFVDQDSERSIAKVTLDIQRTGITFQPGDRLAVMPLNNWIECAKVAAALGFDRMLDEPVPLNTVWQRFAKHLGSVSKIATPRLSIKDILRRGHLAPLTKELVMKLHTMLRASSKTVLQVLAATEWPVRASLGDILQAAVAETPDHIWDQAFDLQNGLHWLTDLVEVEVPRTYSISNYPDELLPSSIDLTVSRSEYNVSSIFQDSEVPRHGVGSSFLNPPMSAQEEFLADDEELLIGVSRPFAFQLPIDDAAPVAMFAGGSGIAPFRSFWQSRAGQSIGRNILFLGVQSREKFCYEEELRDYMKEGHIEVHTAFSRDSRGLKFDRNKRDLVEVTTTPRYIDAAIVEQGAMVCDLVLSKKLGGFGGHLYVCGSLSVFDSVISGIRKAIYNHRTTRMETTDVILDTAFAERRFMLDVFMSPKPLPCNIPTIPMSQLAMHTGHVTDTPIWIAVHGSVYDVTDFCKMHPGGTSIIKSNAGIDCSKSFDLLAHTNNPEVSSLLNKYFIGHLTPKADFRQSDEIGMLHGLWSEYLKTSVETLVSQAFEVHEFMESSHLWFQGNLFNMGGVRRFYHHQSRLLQGGFSALFGGKLQEMYLKLSFTLANAAAGSTPGRIPDVLGTIARAKGSSDAMCTSQIISEIGQFTSDSEAARFHERGILEYARTSVKLDMELLEGIRDDACVGMDAFDSIMDLDVASESQRTTALSTFLLQVMERMAMRLDGFYTKLAQHSIYHAEMEQNPARTRWNLVRRKIYDGSFFVLTQDILFGVDAGTTSSSTRSQDASIELDQVITQIQQSIGKTSKPKQRSLDLTEQHVARGQPSFNGVSANEMHENGNAVRRMSTFMTNNMRAIRRLSRMPTTNAVSLEHLMSAYGPKPIKTHDAMSEVPTPPSSNGSLSRSTSLSRGSDRGSFQPLVLHNLNMRGRSSTNDMPAATPDHRSRVSSSFNTSLLDTMSNHPGSNSSTQSPNQSQSRPQMRINSHQPIAVSSAMPNMFSNMNRRVTAVPEGSATRDMTRAGSARSSQGRNYSNTAGSAGELKEHERMRAGGSLTSLRSFHLQDRNGRIAPTF